MSQGKNWYLEYDLNIDQPAVYRDDIEKELEAKVKFYSRTIGKSDVQRKIDKKKASDLGNDKEYIIADLCNAAIRGKLLQEAKKDKYSKINAILDERVKRYPNFPFIDIEFDNLFSAIKDQNKFSRDSLECMIKEKLTTIINPSSYDTSAIRKYWEIDGAIYKNFDEALKAFQKNDIYEFFGFTDRQVGFSDILRKFDDMLIHEDNEAGFKKVIKSGRSFFINAEEKNKYDIYLTNKFLLRVKNDSVLYSGIDSDEFKIKHGLDTKANKLKEVLPQEDKANARIILWAFCQANNIPVIPSTKEKGVERVVEKNEYSASILKILTSMGKRKLMMLVAGIIIFCIFVMNLFGSGNEVKDISSLPNSLRNTALEVIYRYPFDELKGDTTEFVWNNRVYVASFGLSKENYQEGKALRSKNGAISLVRSNEVIGKLIDISIWEKSNDAVKYKGQYAAVVNEDSASGFMLEKWEELKNNKEQAEAKRQAAVNNDNMRHRSEAMRLSKSDETVQRFFSQLEKENVRRLNNAKQEGKCIWITKAAYKRDNDLIIEGAFYNGGDKRSVLVNSWSVFLYDGGQVKMQKTITPSRGKKAISVAGGELMDNIKFRLPECVNGVNKFSTFVIEPNISFK